MTRSRLHGSALIVLVLVLTAACGGAGEDFDAKAPDVAYIDQYEPAGAGPYYDGSMYCGPALLAGFAKARGQTGGLSDAALVEHLAAVAGTDDRGTTGHGMIAGLNYLGLRTDAAPGADLYWIDDQLAAGHDVIANGDYYSLPGREDPNLVAGHYIAVTAVRDDWTVYEITDPAEGSCRSLEDWQLETFIINHPQGGFTISAW